MQQRQPRTQPIDQVIAIAPLVEKSACGNRRSAQVTNQ